MGRNLAAALVTGMRIRASALASGGNWRASTASMSAAQIPRSLTSARLERNGLVVTPTAPRSNPRSSSAASAESCHHLVGVFLMTQLRYVWLAMG